MNKFSKTASGIGPDTPGSMIPPPPRQDGLRPSRPPRGSRTPSFGAPLPDLSSVPSEAPAWMKRARRMVVALEEAIAQGEVDQVTKAAIERAWSAYELGGVTDDVVVKVSHLCERAHGAIRERFRGSARDAYEGCAQVLFAGLPRSVRKNVELDEVIEVIKVMRGEADAWAAVVQATSTLLRWDHRAQTHAAQAIRVAVDAARR